MRFDPQLLKLPTVDGSGAIVTQFSDISSPEAPLLARSHCTGNLAARQDFRGMKFNLGSDRGIVRETNQGIGSVESDSDKVNLRRLVHFVCVTVDEP